MEHPRSLSPNQSKILVLVLAAPGLYAVGVGLLLVFFLLSSLLFPCQPPSDDEVRQMFQNQRAEFVGFRDYLTEQCGPGRSISAWTPGGAYAGHSAQDAWTLTPECKAEIMERLAGLNLTRMNYRCAAVGETRELSFDVYDEGRGSDVSKSILWTSDPNHKRLVDGLVQSTDVQGNSPHGSMVTELGEDSWYIVYSW